MSTGLLATCRQSRQRHETDVLTHAKRSRDKFSMALIPDETAPIPFTPRDRRSVLVSGPASVRARSPAPGGARSPCAAAPRARDGAFPSRRMLCTRSCLPSPRSPGSPRSGRRVDLLGRRDVQFALGPPPRNSARQHVNLGPNWDCRLPLPNCLGLCAQMWSRRFEVSPTASSVALGEQLLPQTHREAHCPRSRMPARKKVSRNDSPKETSATMPLP